MKTIKINSIIFFCLLAISMEFPKTYAQVTLGIGVTVRDAPPQLPEYAQPPCPVDGYLWTPGYWAYNDNGYYWVPGVWVSPPQAGYLWTPCYWGFTGGYYGFHAGYWGTHIGFYGGVNYGYGYGGSGYYGGRWEGGHFRYNTSVVNVNRTVVHNTYEDRTVIHNSTTNRTSFNGTGGISTKPTQQEAVAMREKHMQPTKEQTSHQEVSGKNRNQFASVNKGRPATTAMNKVGGQSSTPQRQQATAGTKKPANSQVGGNINKPATQSSNPVKKNSPAIQQPRTVKQQASQQKQQAPQQQHVTQQHSPQPQQQKIQQHAPQQKQENHGSQQGGVGHEKR